ncbi:MAG: glycoside hydrolase family 32 protein [Bacteroidota bacterium]
MCARLIPLVVFLVVMACKTEQRSAEDTEGSTTKSYQERYRPQYHFTPVSGWMNDPNGLVYHDGIYHLFYQYYPHATVWGPMHWGHAVSTDMVHWEHQPIALFPDVKGLIFSGSAVVDKNNTSGFGVEGKVPLVAIYTYHNMRGEKSGGNTFQTQGIAYSLDNGNTWEKYDGNPVIGNTGIRDIRDPKVFWHEDSQSWIMVLVAGDHVKFYRSKNLREWDNISDFGKDQGAKGGVWECPDLFKMKVEGSEEEKWVLIISIGSGAPNGGSGTQYVVGDFDGTTFTSDQIGYKWLDWGTDNYAGVTYNNTLNGERIFIGWMSNWQYALKTPATTWRSAMTLPRELSLKRINDDYVLYNYPLSSIDDLMETSKGETISIPAREEYAISNLNMGESNISFSVPAKDFKLTFSNAVGEKTVLILDTASSLLMLDRTASGMTDFNYEFGNKLHYAAMKNVPGDLDFSIYLDRSSIEVFVNGGEYAMTDQLFPSQPYTQLSIENISSKELQIKDLKINVMQSVSQAN